MSYILDNKTNIASMVIPVGDAQVVTVYNSFTVNPVKESTGTTFLEINSTGIIRLGNPDAQNTVKLYSSLDVHFTQVVDTTLTDYQLNRDDYAIEIMSNTINTITLPTAMGSGGRTYVISRGSDNNNLIIRSQPNENIDTRQSLKMSRKYDHLQIMSNGQDSWYII